MTDKQIIVDEINKTIEQEMENLRNIAKQQIGKLEAKLKAKEQECEKLKKQLERKEENYQKLLSKSNKYSLFIEKLCDYAGLECDDEEQAIRTLYDLASQINKVRWIIDRYKQTLTEIKEIAEIEIECKTYEIENDCFNETRCKALNEHIDFIKQILQKINECEEKYEN